MRTRHAREHPSDRLRSGGVHDFEEALVLVDRAHTMERQLGRDEPAEADIERSEQALAQVRATIRHASRVYREEQEAARVRTVDRLRADALAPSAFGVRSRSAFGEPDESEPTASPEGQTPNAKRQTPSKEAALDDEASQWLGLLATALEAGDYSGLAI